MGNTKKWAVFPLSVLLSLSMLSPCHASEEAVEAVSDSVPPLVEVSDMGTLHSADLVPLARSKSEINGQMVITETFEVATDFDPSTLIRDNFVSDGYLYKEESIVKNPYTERKEKDVSLPYSQSTNTSNLSKNIQKLPETLSYDQDGYVGTLYLDPKSVSVKTVSTKTKTSTQSSTQYYTREMNDPSTIPETYNGMPRVSLSWKVNEYVEGSSIPSSYTATAVYSKNVSTKVPNGWKVYANYTGTAIYESTSSIRYTVTYAGEKIPEGYSIEEGKLVPPGYELANGELVPLPATPSPEPEPTTGTSPAPETVPGEISVNTLPTLILMVVLAAILLGIVAGAVFFLLLCALKSGFFASRKITVQAQDDVTGEYQVIQKVKVDKKVPSFTLDTLRLPNARHFLCEMSAQEAKILRGKIITVAADGRIACKHRVEPLDSTSPYVFPVDLDLDAIDSGPLDTSAL